MNANPADDIIDDSQLIRGRRDRWLHRSYHQSSGIRHFISRRLRPAGIALGVVVILAACMGIGHERSAIYQLFSFTVGIGLIGVPWVFFRSARLEAKRDVGRHATAGEPFRYQVKVQNVSRSKIARAWLIESEPDPRPSLVEFSVIKEPGEEERNAYDRFFAYFRWQWLMLRNRLFEENLSKDELVLKRGESTWATMQITPLRRGVIQLHDLRVMLPDPFGIVQKCVKVTAPASTLTVLPKRYLLPPIELPGGVAFRISGETNSNVVGNSGEFVGLRDYRPEDPMRQIHWKSWARTGKPIVKELEDTHYPRYGLVMDSISTDRSDLALEEAISVAASFACSIDTSESLLDLMFVNNEAHKVTVGRGLERADKLLEVLAGVIPKRTGDLKSLGKLVLRHGDDLTSCVVILNGWDEMRAELLKMLDEGGVVCVPIVIGAGPKPDGVPGHWLETGQIQRDLNRLPERL